jgi:hypothetical protein
MWRGMIRVAFFSIRTLYRFDDLMHLSLPSPGFRYLLHRISIHLYIYHLVSVLFQTLCICIAFYAENPENINFENGVETLSVGLS